MNLNHDDNEKCLSECDCNLAEIEEGAQKYVYVDISDDSFSEESSCDEYVNNGKTCFISIYNDPKKLILISNFTEIEKYCKNYSELSDKNVRNVNNIWGNVKITLSCTEQILIKDCNFFKESVKDPKSCTTVNQSKKNTALLDSSSTNTQHNKPTSKVCLKLNHEINKKLDDTAENIEKQKSEKLLPNAPANQKKVESNSVNGTVKLNSLNDCLKDNLNKTSKCEKTTFQKPITITKSNGIDKNLVSNVKSQSDDCNNIKQKIKSNIDTPKKDKKQKKIKSQIKNDKNNIKEKVSIMKTKNNENDKVKIGSETPSKLQKVCIEEKINKIDNIQGESTSNEEDNNVSDDDIALLSNTEHVPAFIAELMKKKEIKINTSKTTQDIKIDSSIPNTDIADEEFVIFSKKRVKTYITEKNIMDSDKLAEQAIDMILNNNLKKALNCLMKAVSFNPSDERHYLNRSYLYLIMNKYTLALEDAEHIIHMNKNIDYALIANLRAGQASFGLQNYKKAEAYLKEAITLNPNNNQLKRQLMRIQIAYIVSIGYSEKVAIQALERYSSTLEAINYLKKSDIILNNVKEESNLEFTHENYEDILFSSDDEEESIVETVNKILNYNPNNNLYQNISKLFNGSSRVTFPLNKTNNEKKNTINTKQKNASNTKKEDNNRSVWVGNLNNKITEEMLKQKFKQFGNILSISRPNKSYAFINYKNSKDAAKVLINSKDHKIEGINLTVQSAASSK